ncbi:MAG TPA: hypothetical protein DDW52_06165 [Planctomycetaceae bacterium]|nr:hypothetical protein [Planctomycetaceae bacterium]
MSDNNKPIHRIRLGAVAASVFANDAQEKTFYNVAIERSYKDGEEWKHTKSFGRDDLLLVAKVADLAHSWIHAQQQAAANPENKPEPSL